MLTPKRRCAAIVRWLRAARLMQIRMSGGSREREQNEATVIPWTPRGPRVVTIDTPLAQCLSAARNSSDDKGTTDSDPMTAMRPGEYNSPIAIGRGAARIERFGWFARPVRAHRMAPGG